MADMDGVWFCANFLGDSFDLTSFDDGSLMLSMIRKRFRSRGEAVRLEPRSDGCWEATNHIRLRRSGKNKLFMQVYSKGNWSSEVPALRDCLAATGKYFRDLVLKETRYDDQEMMIHRETSTVFKVEPLSPSDKAKLFDVEVVDLDARECKICMANASNVVLMPCGHSGLCDQCVHKMLTDKTCITCPFCRQSVQTVSKIDAHASRMVLTPDNMHPISQMIGKPRLAWAD